MATIRPPEIKTLRKSILLSILFLAILISGPVFAKGPPNKVTIVTPGVPEPLEITEFALLDSLAMGHIVDFENPIAEPQTTSTGYEITRWYLVGGTALKAIDKFVYYPAPNGGGGMIYYAGIIDKIFIYGGSPFDGKWYRPTASGELTMLELLTKYDLLPETGKSLHSILPDNILRELANVSLLVVSGPIFYLFYRRRVAIAEHQ